MNTTIRTLAAAAPLTVLALGLGATAAHAEPSSPGIGQVKAATPDEVEPFVPNGTIVLPPHTDPEPDPEQPLDKIALPEGDPVVNPDVPQGPGDDTIAVPPPCPTHGSCGDDDDDDDSDDGSSDTGQPASGDDFERPNRVDAGAGSDHEPLSLGWIVAGGALVTATGAAFAVRRGVRARS